MLNPIASLLYLQNEKEYIYKNFNSFAVEYEKFISTNVYGLEMLLRNFLQS